MDARQGKPRAEKRVGRRPNAVWESGQADLLEGSLNGAIRSTDGPQDS